jgi:hypothetical protein
MSINQIPAELRREDYYQHIDMGFLNRRLCLSTLPPTARANFAERSEPGADHFTVLRNDHFLVTILLDVCDTLGVPTLLEALANGSSRQLFRSTERLAPCPDIYTATRVNHNVILDVEFGKPVSIAYHTEHLVSSTGKMTLSEGVDGGFVESIVGLLHEFDDRFEIEPLVIGAPTLDHARNDGGALLPYIGRDYGEILPEDIDQFGNMHDVVVASAAEWMAVMKNLPEAKVKDAFAQLLTEPTKKDWGGEANDHFSGNVTLGGRRKTAAFLLKGQAADFREMTLEMCGKRADQIYRLTNSGADISVVQHAHLIGEAVRGTLRALTVFPGRPRKYCLIDGQATYRILKAYGLLPSSATVE